VNTFAISLNSYSYGRFDVAECLEQARQTPIRRVELPAEQSRPGSLIPELMVDAPLGGRWQYSLPDLKALLAETGFEVDSLDVFGALGYPGGAGIIKRRIDFAQALGAEIIVMGPHNLALSHRSQASAAEQEAARSFVYAMLRDVADYAADRNVRIALEIHHGIAENAASALQTLEAVGRDNVGINFDTANIYFYNMELDREGAATQLEALADRVFHVHLKDIVRGKTREENVLPPLGTGEVDFRAVFDILHAHDFHGPFSLEVETFHGVHQDDGIEAYQEDVLKSIEYLKSLGEF